MRLLDRFLLRKLLVPLTQCVWGFLILWVAFDLFGELSDFQKLRLRPGDIAQFIERERQRFLDPDVFTGAQRLKRQFRIRVVPRGDKHRIDRGILQYITRGAWLHSRNRNAWRRATRGSHCA